MRKLASIRRIAEIRAIPGADAIECAVVDGWTVVVKRGEFIPGDHAVYFEVDSWIPHELAPFLSKGSEPREYNGIKGERLRTVKLRGQLSQGLLLHMGDIDIVWRNEYKIAGYDLTELLGIQKYEPPVPAQLAGVVKGAWPSAVPKTDEERVQNLTAEWPELSQYNYEISEKLEGSSMTVALIDGEFLVCSRNLNLKETEGNTLWAVARRYDMERRMRELNLDNVAIQGELVGEGVQGNHYGIKGQDFFVYSIYDVREGEYLSPLARPLLTQHLGLRHVPVIAADASIRGNTVEQMLAMANGASELNPAKLREGLVFKAINSQAHWKAVSNQYLLKHG